MPARWIVGCTLAGLWAVAVPLRAETPSPAAVLMHCAARKPPVRGWKALRATCPGAEAALASAHLRSLLPPHWRKRLDSRGLAGLATLARRYGGAPPSARPDATALRNAARRLAPPAPAPSLWDRVRAWVRQWTDPLVKLLQHWLGALAHGSRRARVLRTMLWILGTLLSAIVLLAIYLGMRIGVFRRGSSRASQPRRRGESHGPAAPPHVVPDWVALGDQPSRLLQLLVDALLGARRLDRDRSLTCGELSARARFDTAAQREEFTDIARLAERERFGPPGVIRVPDALLRGARTLHSLCTASPDRDDQGAR